MKNKIQIISLLAVLFAFTFSECKHAGKERFTLTVTYHNLDKMVRPFNGSANDKTPVKAVNGTRIMLQEVPYGGDMNPVIIDSATMVDKDGKISLKGSAKEETIFQLVVENGPMLLFINDEDAPEIDMDLSKKDNYYTVKGSPATEQLRTFIYNYSEKSFVINKAFAEIDSLKQFGGSDSLQILATEKKNDAVKSLNDYLKNVISKSEHPALSLFALGWSSRSFPKQDFEVSLNEVVKKFPEHETLKKLKTMYDMQEAQASAKQEEKKAATNTWVGKPAPELALPTPSGDTVSVSSFRGKYLLIDFWASWCGPCRQENPNVVKAFNQFKSKNFTILGVSLDQAKAPWIKAIKDDQLSWTHISDLKFWDSKAVEVYQFDGIPFNVLVDPNGTIIAENLRGFDLENKLQQVLK